MNSRKSLTIGPKEGASSNRKVLYEADSIDELLEKGTEYARFSGVSNPKWLNVSRPVMGDKKMAQEHRKYSMDLGSEEVLVVE
ncbi:MAG: hypothetical protein LRY66_03295 [Saccharospirillaceae bacterium]|nr:hypothetical protein [Saccharospirillaceae bacterium]MCD8530387.1 hypothetical protein [Saccharospirillaceae bacterium]